MPSSVVSFPAPYLDASLYRLRLPICPPCALHGEIPPPNPHSEATVCAMTRSNTAKLAGSSKIDAMILCALSWRAGRYFHPKLRCYPFYRTRSAMPQGARSDADSSIRRAAVRIETSAKSEVVTVCLWQFAGEDTLQSTAMIAIMIGPPRRDGRLRRCAYGLRMPCPAARGRDQTAERRCRRSLGLLEGELAPARTLGQIE
jgi:hypothetical protein